MEYIPGNSVTNVLGWFKIGPDFLSNVTPGRFPTKAKVKTLSSVKGFSFSLS